MLDWSAAEAEARHIAEGWAAEGGPGGAIMFLDRDGPRTAFSGGLASLEHRLPFSPETPCRYASVSKNFLSAAVLRDGSVDLASPIGSYLALGDEVGAVEVGRALDMTGGLPDTMETAWILGVPPTAAQDREALRRLVSRFEATNFRPGSEISYSKTGYRLVQHALERAGKPYFDILHDTFFRPLDIGILFPEDWSDPVPGLATGYWRDGGAWRIGQYGLHISASGGLAGSARDLAVWAGALLADRAPVAGLLAALSAERFLADGRPTAYGLGLAWTAFGGERFVGHGGSLPGYKTQFLLHPGSGTGVVLVANREDTQAARACQRMLAALLGIALPPRASGVLTPGLYVEAEEPFWLEVGDSTATFLGAQEELFNLGDGWATGLSAHLPMRLRQEGRWISGEVGHVEHSFRRVPDAVAFDPDDWEGVWEVDGDNARFEIDEGEFRMGVGPLLDAVPVRPLAEDCVLITRRDRGPWTQRACLQLNISTIDVVTNRSRIARFEQTF